MTPQEFVATYGITGGAELMTSTTQGDIDTIAYLYVFSRAGQDSKSCTIQEITGPSPHLVAPLTPTDYILALLAQVTRNERFAPRGPSLAWKLDYDAEEVSFVKEWMGPDMWAEFLTIMPA